MKFCSRCGAALAARWLEQDSRQRLACTACNVVHFQNPKVLVMALVCWQDRLLVCRRAEEPARGCWNVPTGYLESGETLQRGAARETFEETGVVVQADELELYSVVNLLQTDQVAVAFRMQLRRKPVLRPGPECLDAKFMSETELRDVDIAWSDKLGDSRERLFRQIRARRFDIHLTDVAASAGEIMAARSYRIKAPADDRRTKRDSA